MSEQTTKDATKQRYGAIDGLRTFSAISIVAMHVLTNGGYGVQGFVFEKLIPSFTDLVFLFMILSGFSVCCGYYDKILNGRISLSTFYIKRYAKVWPFFAFWSVADLIISPSLNALYEVFANLTLCFGLLPDANISVIGVGWFLGVVFVFYMVFPFICWLLMDKRRAWLAFAAAFIFNCLCGEYFDAGRTSFIYCAVFFLAGGLIFLYKEQLGRFAGKSKWFFLLGAVIMVVVFYAVGSCVPVMLLLFGLTLMYTLDESGKYPVLENCFTKFLGGISMEIYLCHMVAFRILEKIGLTNLFGSAVLSFVVATVLTFVSAVLLSVLVNHFMALSGQWIKKFKEKYTSYNKER